MKPSELVDDVDLSEKLYKRTCEILKIDGEAFVENIKIQEKVIES